jgi:hypothetical protein
MLLVALLALGGSACSQAVGGEERSSAELSGDSSSTLDFEDPLGPLGEEVQDAVAAGLPFVPILPGRPGATVRQFVALAPDDPSAATAAFVYDDPEWGRVVVLQYSDAQTQEGLIKEEASQESGGCSPVPEYGDEAVSCTFAPHDTVDLGRGTIALIASGAERTSLTWVAELDPAPGFVIDDFTPNTGVTVEVVGESPTFSKADAIEFGELAVETTSPTA